MPSNVGGCIPYDPEISLQGEDLERFSHIYKVLYTRVGLIAVFECLKRNNSLRGEDRLRFIIMKSNVEANVNQLHPHASTQVSIKTICFWGKGKLHKYRYN